MSIIAVAVCEGEVIDFKYEFNTIEEFRAYANGFSDGANQYGAGGAGVYRKEDIPEMEKNPLDRCIAAKLKKYFANDFHS